MSHPVSSAALRRVGIVGVGLIGGSLAIGLRRSAPGAVIVGCDNSTVLRRARRLRLIDDTVSRVEGLLDTCGVIVLCAPLDANCKVLRKLRSTRNERRGVIVDFSSLQAPPVAAWKTAPRRNEWEFVSCHPMAGSEASGPESANADVFPGATLYVDANARLSGEGKLTLAKLAKHLGMRTARVSNEDHDRAMAYVSHLPQLVAVALAQALAPKSASHLKLAGGGVRGMTRLAGSSAALWEPLVRANQGATLDAMNQFTAAWLHLVETVSSQRTLTGAFRSARKVYTCLL